MSEKHSEDQARAQLAGIIEMAKALHTASETDFSRGIDGDILDADQVLERIQEHPLSIEVRSDWYIPSSDAAGNAPAEYCILLCTGGPAVRIVGGLDRYCEPDGVRLEHQDWGTPWAVLPIDEASREWLLVYARQFYFGD